MNVKGCTSGAPPHYTHKEAICYAVPDEAGNFLFQSVPVGKHIVVSVVTMSKKAVYIYNVTLKVVNF